jgi:hypothetical protein
MGDSTKNIKEVSPNKIHWKNVEKDLIETQDLWWLNEIIVDGKKKTQLEDALVKGRSFKKEKVFEEDMEVKLEPGDRTPVKIKMESERNELFAPKNWLTTENFRNYVRPTVEILKKYKKEKGHLDKHTDEAFEELKEELRQINESSENLGGHRKPHTAFATHTKKLKVKRLDAWHDLKQFAQKSRGENQIDLPGYGLTFLKMDKDIAKGNLRYKDTAFENPNDGYLITKKAFDSAWDKA